MPLVKMRMLPEPGCSDEILDILLNTDAVQFVARFGDRVVLVMLGNENIIRCEGTVDEFLAMVDRAEGK